MTKFLVLLMLFSLSFAAQAKRFTNQYCEFELPDGWICDLEGSEYVCQSTNDERRKEAIIILAAKIRGEQDDMEQYQGYLKGTKTYVLPGGKKQISEPKYVKVQNINGQPWVDAMHLASEVPGFYTRYLATVKEDLGVAVTFSVAKPYYDAYAGVFDRIIASLRVFRQKQVDLSKYRKDARGEGVLDNVTFVDEEMPTHDLAGKKGKGGGAGGADDLMLYGLLGLGAVIFIIMKKKKKGAPKKKKAAAKKKKSE